MLNKRQHQVISFLIKQTQPVTVMELAKICRVSIKTIRNELNILSVVANSHQLQLIKKPSVGVYVLDKDDPHWYQLLEKTVYLDKEARQLQLMFCLLTHKKCSITETAFYINVSRQTITRDLSGMLKRFDFKSDELKRTTHGCFLQIDEKILRTKLKNQWLNQEATHDFAKYLYSSFPSEYESIRLWTIQLQAHLNAEFEEASFGYLHVLATVLLIRSHFACYDQINLTNQTKELLEFSDVKFDNLGRSILHEAILGSRLIKGSLTNTHIDDDLACELLKNLFDSLQLKLDLQETAVNGLLMHLRATITRTQTGKIIENPLLEDVKVSLSLLYEVVQRVMVDFEKQHELMFSDHEITYIVMHLGVLMQSHVYLGAPIKIAVVCQHGSATSMLLFSRIKALLPSHPIMGPYSVKEYQKMTKFDVFDAVITTIPMGLNNELVVNPLLTSKDTELIGKSIWSCTYRKQCDMLLESYSATKVESIIMAQMIKSEHIQLYDEDISWKSAIELASKPLLDDQVIEKSYIEKMVWAVETLGPYMVILPQVAFVHAAYDDGVNRNGISCLRLKRPIVFGIQRAVDVKVIFVIASKAKEDMGLLKLVSILEAKNNLNVLMNSNDLTAILKLKR